MSRRAAPQHARLTRRAVRILLVLGLTFLGLLSGIAISPRSLTAPRFQPNLRGGARVDADQSLFSAKITPWSLGNYPDTSVPLGGNTIVSPDDGPIGANGIGISVSTNFKGKVEGNPTTGKLQITNAHPAGSYTVQVTAFDGVPTIKSFVLTVTTPATCNPVTFAPATTVNLGSAATAYGLAVGDFNGDGTQDIVTAEELQNRISIMLGVAGGFGAPTRFTVGNRPLNVAVGDFNGDGKQDLAVTSHTTNNVSVLLGDGSGSFGAPANIAAGAQSFSVVVGDFNGDSKQDLATANDSANSVSVLLGDGAGGFGAPTNLGVGTGPSSVAVGDFNGDGNQDLVTANSGSANLSILFGNGPGGFGLATTFGPIPGATSVAVGDFNGDGRQDLVTANSATANVSVFLGNGAGGFSVPNTFGVNTQSFSVAIGDFNGDGNQDLAIPSQLTNTVSILLGDGAGSFTAANNFQILGTATKTVVVGDFDGDGKEDLAATNQTSDNFSVLMRQCAPADIVAVTNTADSGPKSLRQAIIDANNTPGVQTIVFEVPGAGVKTFNITAPLDVTQPLIIDGYTQPGTGANTSANNDNAVLLIELNGNDAPFNGLNITGGGSTVRGLAINRFGVGGIRLSGNGGTTVEGCFIGTDSTGKIASGNKVGISVAASQSNTIGGATPAARNIISGNSSAGIQIGDTNQAVTMNNSVLGNFIGADAGGGPLGNGINSVAGANGIFIPANATGATIQGNRIAYNTGSISSGTGNGVRIPSPANGSDASGIQIQILDNEIFGNSALAIDLGPAGITPNDQLDADTGPNNLQNFPDLSSFSPLSVGDTSERSSDSEVMKPLRTEAVTVGGTLRSTPNQTYIVNWYFSVDSQCVTSQQGSRPLVFGRIPGVSTDSSGNASFSFPFDFPPGTAAGVINCTATDSLGNTSEYSSCLPVNSSPTLVQFSAAGYSVNEGAGNVTIAVTRVGNTTGAATVDFAASDGSATQNQDYVVTSGTLNFAAGESSKTFLVLIVDEGYVEANETINLNLSNATGSGLGSLNSATITINDNDSGGSITPLPKRFAALLDGGQETPANNSTAKGTGYVLLDGSETSALVGLQFQNLGSAEISAHIHGAGAAGVSAPILFTLAPPLINPIVNMSINPTAQQVTDLKAGLHYFNVHSTNFPNGEIRGQLRWNPTLEENFFVRQQYLDFLSRDGDPGGFGFWVNQVSSCQADAQCLHDRTISTSNAFFFEPEFQQTAGYVFRAYRAAYGNTQPFPNPDSSNATEANKLIDYSAFVADRARVVGGANLAAAQVAFANQFVLRSPFTSRYGAGLNTAALFVDAILANIQTADGVNLTAQRQTLIDQYTSAGGGNAGRAQVLYRLADDNAQNPVNNQALINAEYNRQFALTLYFGYLRRNPDIGGFLFWESQINSAPLRNVDKQNALVCSFLTAAEYQFRFGSSAPRSNAECPQ